MPAQRTAKLTPQEYLAIERQAVTKSDFYNGEMFAMAGARIVHNGIKDNFIYELMKGFQGGSCHTYSSDTKVRSEENDLYVYPDIIIVCGKPIVLDSNGDVLLNPTGIVEILSPSTEKYDRGLKFYRLRRISTLNEYVLVSTSKKVVERYQRTTDNTWILTTYESGDTVTLSTGPISFPVDAIYNGVTLADDNELTDTEQA